MNDKQQDGVLEEGRPVRRSKPLAECLQPPLTPTAVTSRRIASPAHWGGRSPTACGWIPRARTGRNGLAVAKQLSMQVRWEA